MANQIWSVLTASVWRMMVDLGAVGPGGENVWAPLDGAVPMDSQGNEYDGGNPLPVTGTVTPSANALQTVTATIANGESLSGEVDLGEGRVLVGIIMPAAWTAAAMTFQSGVATGVVANLFQFGAEVSYTVDASQYISLQDVMHFYGARYVRVRSGPAATPQAQGGERAITLVTARR